MSSVKRQYRQAARAEKTAATRLRIVEAAIELHGTVGPANSSLSEVARKAGVSRPTLYSHFPDEASLFRACTRHWISQDPPPDPSAWLAIDDPRQRVATALRELYAHYDRNEQVTGNVLRDMHQVESMKSFNVPLVEQSFAAMREILGSEFGDDSELAVRRRAMVSVAIDFHTWRTLVRIGRLANDDAAGLMAHLVACVR